MKKFFLTFLSIIVLFSSVTYASKSITATLDGKRITFDTDPIVVDGSTLVPLRPIFEALGATVNWNSQTKTITSTLNENMIALSLDSRHAYKNGQEFEISVAPKSFNGRTYVPLRFIAESFGVEVSWDSNTESVTMTTDRIVYSDYVSYSTSNLGLLAKNIIEGKVIYYGGEYWATPEYASLLANVEVLHYNETDNGETFNPERFQERYDLVDAEFEWVSGYSLEKTSVRIDELDSYDISELEESEIPDFYLIYAFVLSENYSNNQYYFVPDMTDEFMESDDATDTFSGIRMKKEDDTLFFDYDDLVENGIE